MATVSMTKDGLLRCTFDEPQRAITPGQALVMYDGDYVVGGGIIAQSLGENGYVKFANGLILQWGTYNQQFTAF